MYLAKGTISDLPTSTVFRETRRRQEEAEAAARVSKGGYGEGGEVDSEEDDWEYVGGKCCSNGGYVYVYGGYHSMHTLHSPPSDTQTQTRGFRVLLVYKHILESLGSI